MKKTKITYKSSGVDIEKAERFKKNIKSLVRQSFSPQVLKDIGGFGSFFSFPQGKYKKPVLVSSTDGVGTKLKIAALVNKHDTVGIDLVGMNVNDILCVGAEPLFFLDYISSGKLDPGVLFNVVKGINKGCIESGCSLIGGETAEMPGMYKGGEYDLAGFCVGVVEEGKIIDGKRISMGDKVIGLESNGLHSNGYSLVRKVLSKKELIRMHEELLKPTRLYVKPVLSILQSTVHSLRLRQGYGGQAQSTVKGIAHITGGAFFGKIPRIIPEGLSIKIIKNSWPIPQIFKYLQNKANIDDRQMFSTFNMGIGMVLVADAKEADTIRAQLAKFNLRSWVIGEVIKGNKEVII
ncbi:MAG: phosphoribosylformylglycinamidine cyclo-ligase [Candidatus Omnitrophota bacterium]